MKIIATKSSIFKDKTIAEFVEIKKKLNQLFAKN